MSPPQKRPTRASDCSDVIKREKTLQNPIAEIKDSENLLFRLKIEMPRVESSPWRIRISDWFLEFISPTVLEDQSHRPPLPPPMLNVYLSPISAPLLNLRSFRLLDNAGSRTSFAGQEDREQWREKTELLSRVSPLSTTLWEANLILGVSLTKQSVIRQGSEVPAGPLRVGLIGSVESSVKAKGGSKVRHTLSSEPAEAFTFSGTAGPDSPTHEKLDPTASRPVKVLGSSTRFSSPTGTTAVRGSDHHRGQRGAPETPFRRERFSAGDAGDVVDCSGKSCRSCSGNLLADCVAVCCCPCSVVSLLVLAFVKLPWAAGKRCVGAVKMKGRGDGWKSKRKVRGIEREEGRGSTNIDVKKDREYYSCKKKNIEAENINMNGESKFPKRDINEAGNEEDDYEWQVENFSAGREAERVWMELYQIGHLGFGRVSFTGSTPGKPI
ncbi:hypothetical protein H6P81_009906 [Aristolochia fimbriata]|uniref:Uncharacterized protein n=1 Tax=Aristolochia fimbriata TaxID=158543 RepID=A0AAV7EQJ6_ARIFI|nr:hypothetical protein H6P81_009906 [Aristolochia fimbriata]